MLKNLKSLFVVEEESDKKEESKDKKPDTKKANTVEGTSNSTSVSGERDKAISKKLLKAIEDKN